MRTAAHLKELLFQNKSTEQTAAKNVFWLSFSEVASRLIRGVFLIYAARILGTAEYGIFSYTLGLAAFFTVFADVGIMQILTREAARKPEERHYYFATAFWMKMTLLAFTAALVIFVAPHFSNIEAAKAIIPFMAVLVFFDGIREFSLAFIRALQKMEYQALITIVTNVAIAASGFAILYYMASTRALSLAYVASAGAGALVAVWMLRKEFARVVSSFQKHLVKTIFSSAWPLLFTTMLGTFMLNTDIIMLGWYKDASEIGLYSAAQKVILILYTLPAIFASGIFPILAREAESNNMEQFKRLVERVMTVVYGLALPITVGGIIVAHPLMLFLYGSAYESSTLTFQILLLTTLLTFPGIIVSSVILAHNEQKKLAWYIGIASFSNFFFNALLIPVWGGPGSAVSTVISQLLNNGLAWLFAKRIHNFYTLRYLKTAAAATAVMGTAAFGMLYAGIPALAMIVVSAALYGLLLYFLKDRMVTDVIAMIRRI